MGVKPCLMHTKISIALLLQQANLSVQMERGTKCIVACKLVFLPPIVLQYHAVVITF